MNNREDKHTSCNQNDFSSSSPFDANFERVFEKFSNSFHETLLQKQFPINLYERISTLEERVRDYQEMKNKVLALESRCLTKENCHKEEEAKKSWLYAQIPQWAMVLMTLVCMTIALLSYLSSH